MTPPPRLTTRPGEDYLRAMFIEATLARCRAGAIAFGAALAGAAAAADGVVPYRIDGDAIRRPLTAAPGDPRRGRDVLAGRDGNCLLCHAVPESGERFMGNLAPPPSGIADRLDAGQIRLRIVDASRLNPETIMPPYHRVDGLTLVAPAWRGKPLLDAGQIEDVIAYLLTLRR